MGLNSEALAIVERAIERLEKAKALAVEIGNKAARYDGTLFGPEARHNTYKRASAKLIEAGRITNNITLRDLRHAHASLALASGTDIKALMASMGHKDLAIAARYQHSTLARTAAAVVGASRRKSMQKVEQQPESKAKGPKSKKKSPSQNG